MRCGHILGTTFSVEGVALVPEKVPVIFVSNHQSLMICFILMIWYLRKAHPKFVSKKELGKGIPSVSFNLKRGGSVLIDRKDSKTGITYYQRIGRIHPEIQQISCYFPGRNRVQNGCT
ncbi:lysophospholipid acyltransferase family protein [Paenimyroides ceti]|uniref:lysophospholipid acyltransferase family protein n=1 Tax=Paenimyroides ceti TaxID=395087 RepID=UPI00294FF3C5|nr:1-acyl-sn-glycerol-3-phosphate acyltransferase [Paenimyroides ceti]